jgi:hypothetical protein
MDDERWSSDLNLLCERLSERLARDGAEHAGAAALCVAVRGLEGSGAREFAVEVGLTTAELSRLETGEVPWDELPTEIRRRAEAEPRLDLERLRPRPSAE